MKSGIRNLIALTVLAGCGAAAQSAAPSDAELTAGLHVSGVRVSASGEVAIINDRLVGVGQRIGQAEVLAIESNLVHIRAGGRTFAMRPGSPLLRDSQLRETAPTPTPAPTRKAAYGPVAPGETLSEIAEALLPAGVSRQRMMTALFDANPDSFGSDMNVLFAGAVLAIPEPVATAPDSQRALARESAEQPTDTLSVVPGDTLSEIAQRLRGDDVTLHQAMVALYDANPASFGGNMNLLFAGSVLHIPGATTMQARAPAAASMAVRRAATLWRATTADSADHVITQAALTVNNRY